MGEMTPHMICQRCKQLGLVFRYILGYFSWSLGMAHCLYQRNELHGILRAYRCAPQLTTCVFMCVCMYVCIHACACNVHVPVCPIEHGESETRDGIRILHYSCKSMLGGGEKEIQSLINASCTHASMCTCMLFTMYLYIFHVVYMYLYIFYMWSTTTKPTYMYNLMYVHTCNAKDPSIGHVPSYIYMQRNQPNNLPHVCTGMLVVLTDVTRGSLYTCT